MEKKQDKNQNEDNFNQEEEEYDDIDLQSPEDTRRVPNMNNNLPELDEDRTYFFQEQFNIPFGLRQNNNDNSLDHSFDFKKHLDNPANSLDESDEDESAQHPKVDFHNFRRSPQNDSNLGNDHSFSFDRKPMSNKPFLRNHIGGLNKRDNGPGDDLFNKGSKFDHSHNFRSRQPPYAPMSTINDDSSDDDIFPNGPPGFEKFNAHGHGHEMGMRGMGFGGLGLGGMAFGGNERGMREMGLREIGMRGLGMRAMGMHDHNFGPKSEPLKMKPKIHKTYYFNQKTPEDVILPFYDLE